MAKTRLKTKTLNKIQPNISKKMMAVFLKNRKKSFNYKQLISGMNERDEGVKRLVLDILNNWEKQGKVVQVERGKFKLVKATSDTVEGIMRFSKNGRSFLEVENMQEDIPVDKKHCSTSLEGDRVLATIVHKKDKIIAQVVEVVLRSKTRFVGTLHVKENFAFLLPDDQKIHVDLFIPQNKIKGAKDGDKVVVNLVSWLNPSDNPVGEVIEVIGKSGEPKVELESIMLEFGLSLDFPDDVQKEADSVELSISKDEIEKRKDFREVTTFTIDPKGAKDFDDALSIRNLNNGNWEIGVHIADVSHYVKKGSAMDTEALRRATSVYMADRVVPMLPEILSNHVCSLRPKEEKLAYAVIFEINSSADVKSNWIGRTVINSDHRFTYEEAQQVIEGNSTTFSKELTVLNDLAKILRNKRLKQGALAFGGDEIKFELDENGFPIGILTKEIVEANHLIEEFMLLANRTTAEWVNQGDKKKVKPFIYRVHDLPSMEKIKNLVSVAQNLGYQINIQEKDISGGINKLLEMCKDKPEESLLRQMSIRCMAKAEYDTNNIGHYGLAFKHYTHFTSPIRRYPDVLAHRILDKYKQEKAGVNADELKKECRHSSIMERNAVDAERASIKYLQTLYLENKIGEQFTGTITGLTNWGIYVEIGDTRCEGMIQLSEMEDDQYYFDAEKYQVVGRKYKEKFNMGDKLKVEIAAVSVVKRQVDLRLLQ